MVQLRLTPANIRTLVISVGSEKLITYEAATRIDLLKSVHINGAVSVNEVDSLCHTCDVKASPQFSDVEVTWQNGSWPLVGNVTCKEEGFTWKAISASHAMCFADIWSLSGECEEQTIQNPTVGKVYLLRRNPLVGHTLSIKGIPSANTSFSLALTKGNDAPVVFIFQFQSQKIIGKSKIMKGDSKKTFYRVFPLIVGKPFAIIMTIIKMDEVAVQVDSLREPLQFEVYTAELLGQTHYR
ncbi:uncharacterized protein LOC112559542 [Pomacea canaliculata]|uniref:uncharacterized protein LOC112559542 n=1 Tax=Pomacea canaliculata TaxID=400727 RepID=UPI000D7319A5|nr:uncharacterized protein LOC112559542 [Pomacea canaliculata]